jgi:hypothetical protein
LLAAVLSLVAEVGDVSLLLELSSPPHAASASAAATTVHPAIRATDRLVRLRSIGSPRVWLQPRETL